MSEDLKSSWYQIPGNREKFNTSRSISNTVAINLEITRKRKRAI